MVLGEILYIERYTGMNSRGISRNLLIAGTIIVLFVAAGILFLFASAPQSQDIPYLSGPPAQESSGAAEFTPDEQAWILSHPSVRVCPDPDYPPFEFFDANGNYAGISADYLHLISEKTGLEFTVVRAGDWNECVRLIKENKTDLLGAVYISDLRTGYLNYSYPIYQMPLVIITNSSVPPGLTLEKLNGSTVAVVEGYTSHALLLENYPGINILAEPNTRSGLRDVSFGRADAFFGDLGSASWFADKNELTNLRISGEYRSPDANQYQLAFGIKKDEPELTTILNKGLSRITPEESAKITGTWIPVTLQHTDMDPRILTGLFLGLVILVVLVGIIFAWNRALRRAVSLKTKELSLELEERKKAQESLKESEQKYRSILENIDDVFYRTDITGKLIMMSPSGAALLGYTSPDELVGKTLDTLIYGKPPQRQEFIQELQEKGSLRDYERMLKRRDGSAVWVSTSSQFYDGPDGQVAGIEGIFRDISRRKADEEVLLKKNEELESARQQIAAAEAELRRNYVELSRSQHALEQARRKLSLLNTILFQDIRSSIFSLYGYLELEKTLVTDPRHLEYIEKQIALIKSITGTLRFSDTYQNLGLTPPAWQNVGQAFVYGISHLDTSCLTWTYEVKGLEIYADPLLEQVFMILADNVIVYGKTATEMKLSFCTTDEGITISLAGNGEGIPTDLKEKIFDRTYKKEQDLGLFLAREILSVTGSTLKETGIPGKGVRFEIFVPKGSYRFVDNA